MEKQQEAGSDLRRDVSTKAPRPFGRFLLGIVGIVLYFALIVLVLKIVFIIDNWPALRQAGGQAIGKALAEGARFDAAALTWLLAPALLLYYVAAVTKWRPLLFGLIAYMALLATLISLVYLADLQYFREAGKHFTYEVTVYLDNSILPVITGAFRLHPWLSWLSLLACAVVFFATWWVFRRWLKVCLLTDGRRRPAYLLTLPVLVAIGLVAARGGWQPRPLHVGNSLISPSPQVDALCLSPLYSIMSTLALPSGRPIHFYDEKSNIGTVRKMLNLDETAPYSHKFPLLRTSPGTDRGNRKNVVLFLLESWSAKEIGCLGGKKHVTPVFDGLAQEGLLFTNFFANGVRTSEGICSILCSFPNPPGKPILHRPISHQTRWRPISQILAEVGYHNIFVHGRDLQFGETEPFLWSASFHEVIDRDDFPPSDSHAEYSWPGHSDEDVIRRADEEFAAEGDHPFFGVIYTMNTHPPFVTPDGFPLAFPPDSAANKYLNSLRYSDHSLGVFFKLAGSRPYFKNTVFIFVADHARTEDRSFNLSNQHHIPFMIYAPGYVRPGTGSIVGSQVDIFPTILGLLQLKATHAAWGQDLLQSPTNQGFAVCAVGNSLRWHDAKHVLADGLSSIPPLLFNTFDDPDCSADVGDRDPRTRDELKKELRAYISLSQTLLYQDRIYPRNMPMIAGGDRSNERALPVVP